MLCVPVEEEIPEVADSVVKAITGEGRVRDNVAESSV